MAPGFTPSLTLALLCVPLVLASPSTAAEHDNEIRRVESDTYAVVFFESGTVQLLAGSEGERVPLATLENVASADGAHRARGPMRLSNSADAADARDVVHVENVATMLSKRQSAWPEIRAQGPTGSEISAVWTFLPESVRVVYAFPRDDAGQTDTALLPIRLDEGTECVEKFKPARWLQHPHGGEPYQQTAGTVNRYRRGDASMCIAVDGGFEDLVKDGAICLKARPFRRPWQTDRIEAAAAFDFGKEAFAPYRGVALAGRDRLMLNVESPQPFYLWDSLAEPITLQANAVNLSERTETVNLNVVARTIDGEVLLESTEYRRLMPLEKWTVPVAFPVKTPGPVYLTVEAQHPWQTVVQEFCLGFLPQRDFQDDRDSRFGISAYTNEVPRHPESRGEEAVFHLMRRMGVRWLRMASDRGLAHRSGLYTWYQNSVYGPAFADYREGRPSWMHDAKNREEMLRGNLLLAKKNGDVVLEWTNEWNLIGGEGNAVMAERYVKDWMLPLLALRNDLAPEIKLAGPVIAGGDLAYLRKVYEAGGWPTFDYLDFHAGGDPRSPDYEAEGDCWSYLTTLRGIHEAMRKYGAKPLWMTEFYAPTAANSSINHNERVASQNLTLEIALAVAADVRGMMYYRFNDADYGTEIHDPETTSEPLNRETYFGLVRRDWCPKAGVWAYQTAAWMFDGASFLGDVPMTEQDSFGLLFDGNRGQFAVLWSRKEGYQTAVPAHPRTGARRPWQTHYSVRTPVSLRAKGDSITVIDWVGREQIVQADSDGQATIELTGAPIYVLGADLEPHQGKFSLMFQSEPSPVKAKE